MKDPRPLQRFDKPLAVALLFVWTLFALAGQWDVWAMDLAAVYMAGWFWQAGAADLVYAMPPGFFGGTPPAWADALTALGAGDETAFPFIYPPVWAALAAPLTSVLSPQGFMNLIAAIQVPLLAASIPLAARIMRPASMSLTLWTILSLPVLQFTLPFISALMLNQPSITMCFLTLLAVERLFAGRPAVAGAALAVAAMLKLTPLGFLAVFLMGGQWRGIAVFALTFTALGATGLALTSADLHVDFAQSARAASDSALLSIMNISLKPAIQSAASVLGFGPSVDLSAQKDLLLHAGSAWAARGVSIAALAVLVVIGARLRAAPFAHHRRVAFCALAIAIPLFGPLGWQHYYTLPLLLLPGLIVLMPPVPALLLGGLPLIAAFPPVIRVFATLPFPTASPVWATCLAWLALLLGLAVYAKPRPTPAAPPLGA